ncbi:MAG: hypothetical protein AAF525_20425 [Pseudomonadota bacterium]
MKYLTIISSLVCLFVGFATAWWLIDESSNGSISQSHTPAMAPDVTIIPAPRRQAEGVLNYRQLGNQDSVFDEGLLAYRLAAAASIDQLETMTLDAVRSRDPLFNFVFTNIFLERYVAIDGRRAMSFVEQHWELNNQTMHGHIMTSWLRNAPQEAMRYFRTSDTAFRETIGARLLDDPMTQQLGLYDEVAQLAGRRGVAMARQMRTRHLPPEELFEQAINKTGQQGAMSMHNAIARWMQTDPESALARVSSLPAGAHRTNMLNYAIGLYARRAPGEALSYVRNHHPGNTQMELSALTHLSAIDPVAALPEVEDYVSRTGSNQALNQLLGAWTQSSPDDAIAYADTLSGGQLNSAYRAIANAYINTDPERGFEWVVSLPDQFHTLRNRVLQRINPMNEQAARDVLERTNDETARAHLITGIARSGSRGDPVATIDWLEGYKNEPVYNDALKALLNNIASQQPALAANTVPNGLVQEMAPMIAQHWYTTDAAETLSWLSQLEDSVHDNAISQLAQQTASHNANDALSLLSRIKDPAIEKQASTGVAWQWASTEPDELEYIIDVLELDDQTASRLREQQPRRFTAR